MNYDGHSLAGRVRSFCAKIGNDPLLVQGAGGNVSWKDDGVLWVKASGTRLTQALENDIFVPVDLHQSQAAIASGDFGVMKPMFGTSLLRPSIETPLHAMMPHRVVVHVHAVEVVAHLVRRQPERQISVSVRDMLRWICVDYFRPGAELAEAVAKHMDSITDVDVIFLKNHGVVIGGADVSEVEEVLDLLVVSLRNKILDLHPSSNTNVRVKSLESRGYTMCKDAQVNELAFENRLFKRLSSEWALYPDHVVFLGPQAVVLSDDAAVEVFSELRSTPPYLFVLGKGVFESHLVTDVHRAQMRCYFDVLVRQPADELLDTLSDRQVHELLNWDAEKYRQSMR